MPWIKTVPQPRANLATHARPRSKARAWYEIRNADDEAEVLVYDEIGGWFGGGAEEFVQELRGITAPRMTVRVNSPGGSVFDGVTMANALRAHPSNVTVYVDGIAASIASVIAMAGDRLVMMPQSQLMIHDASGLSIGSASDMREMADLLDRQSDNIAEAYADKAGGTMDEWRVRMRAETWYSAREAVDAGLADEMAPMPRRREREEEEREPATAARWDLSVFRYAGREDAPAPPMATAEGGTAHGAAPVSDAPTDGSSSTLTIDVRGAVGTELEDMLRRLVAADTGAPALEATAVPKHSTGTTEGEWDGPAQEKKLPSPVPVATAKKMYAWYDGDQVEDGAVPKSACKLPHHTVSEDGTPGAAVMAGVRNALSRLPQTKGIPESEKATIEAHLRAHLKAGGGGDEAEDHAHAHADAETTGQAEPPGHPDTAQPTEAPPTPDGWAAQTAHLTTLDDDWARLVAHLTDESPLALSSGAATA
ncbi:head maturation protease, ClpP-related [Streptomyces boncukensis]|uniref:ATP-dependent Clp protease proteolytic subunit n=1 Tax=Streptomyces boncukensis TaxID=2711219 RepID=A0A6G4WV82_9ACTN|nr:head maturation protease, ClpP-related [Streptomyces boncukensis]NGO68527.1 hypothetical protein [Streptomyces boncukensis]